MPHGHGDRLAFKNAHTNPLIHLKWKKPNSVNGMIEMPVLPLKNCPH